MSERTIIPDGDMSEWNTTIPHRNWCFTWNNYSEEDYIRISSLSSQQCNYVIVAKEVGDNGTPHLQGYIELCKPSRLTGVKKLLDELRGKSSPIHLEPRAAACRDRAILYCKKSTQPKDQWLALKELGNEYGRDAVFKETIHKVSAQGHRSDWDAIRDKCKVANSLADVADDYPEHAIRYSTGIMSLIASYKQRHEIDALKAQFEHNFELRPWQATLVKEIDNSVGTGIVRWIFCDTGLTGKSELAKWLAIYRGALAISNGRTADIAHAWNGEQLVILDISRTSEERLNYDALERLASGLIFSGKYNSAPKIARRPYIVVFANCLPIWQTLSVGRWNVSKLEKGELFPICDPRTV